MESAIGGAEAEELNMAERGADPRHRSSRMSRAVRSELAQHYNELHALIVRAGNHYCRSTAKCEGCPLKKFLVPESSATA